MVSAFSAIARAGAGALLTLADPVFGTDPPRLAQLAAQNRLPARFFEETFVDAGSLMAFGPDIAGQFRRAAVYVDKILKGALAVGRKARSESRRILPSPLQFSELTCYALDDLCPVAAA